MSDVLAAYRRIRDQGAGHHKTCRLLARDFNLDQATVGRVVNRALDDERRDRARQKRDRPLAESTDLAAGVSPTGAAAKAQPPAGPPSAHAAGRGAKRHHDPHTKGTHAA